MAMLETKLQELEQVGVAVPIVDRLRTYIAEQETPRLQAISAYRLADAWGLPRREVLEAFLYGTRVGIFDLRWNIHCPSCKGVTEHADHLALLKPTSHCEYCQIDIRANFDDDVEVTFQVNDNIRPVEEASLVALAQAWDLWDILDEVTIAPYSTQHITLEVRAGTYYAGHVTLLVDAVMHDAPQPVRLAFDGERLLREDAQALHAGTLVLEIANPTAETLHEHLVYRKEYPWTSAAQVASTQSFRDLFSTELISTDETFSIRSMVMVFTDIKGSTAMYEQLGDSDAYFLVKKHFKTLMETVRDHNGAVVKTIGDAVMATFLVTEDAVAALFAMQRAFDAFDVQEKIPEGHIIIKVGAHRGPCIAVTSNDRLDYFGRTVNLAARVQGLSTGRDIVMSQSLYEEEGARQIVRESGWQAQSFDADLRGFTSKYRVVRLLPPRA